VLDDLFVSSDFPSFLFFAGFAAIVIAIATRTKHTMTEYDSELEQARELAKRVRQTQMQKLCEQDRADEEAGLRARGLATVGSDVTDRY
jgi:hypothetical protein